jgi:heme o synthase
MMCFQDILRLVKFKIALAITFTTATGFILFAHTIHLNLLWSVLGVFFLSSGSMAINQLQEQRYDALMKRTQDRPLPRGSMNSRQVIGIAILCILTGSGILYLFFPLLTVILGIFNLVWYNLVYTPLKRHTPFAVIPGSINRCRTGIYWVDCSRRLYCRLSDMGVGSFLNHLANPTLLANPSLQ